MLAITVTGYVAFEPRVNTSESAPVCNFTILSNFKKGDKDIVSSVDVAVWGKRSEVASTYIKKGSLVTVTGTGYIEAFERKDGSPGAKIAMTAADFTLPPRSSVDL